MFKFTHVLDTANGVTYIPPMSADEAAGMIKALTAVMESEGCTGNEIEDMADDIRHLLKQGEAAR